MPQPVLEALSQAFVEKLEASGAKPIYKLKPAKARQVLEDAQRESAPAAGTDAETRTIKAAPSGDISVRIVRPDGENGILPAVIYMHGGGWILGSFDTHQRMVRQLADASKAAVVFVEYTPSPEAKFPVANEQSYSVLQHCATHGGELGIDGTRLALAGDSVGGNMAAAVTLMAKERGGARIRQQVLFYPVTSARMDTRSYKEFAKGPWLTKPAMKWFWDAYAPAEMERTNPLISPIEATIEQLRGLPPALIISAENDVLRDEGEAYARRLIEAGVDVEAVRCLGTMHDFVMLNALAESRATQSAIAYAGQALRRAFATEDVASATHA